MKLPCFEFGTPGLIEQIQTTLASLGGCVVQGLPCSEDNAALETLAHALGEPLLEPHNLQGGMVCRIEAEHQENRPYANTPWHFPAHTDCTDYLHPPQILLLLCEQPANDGGNSFVALVPQVLEQLAADDIFALQESRFYFRFGYLPILTLNRGRVAMRYSRQMLEMFKQPEQTTETNELLDRLDQAIEVVRFEFGLNRGDCLILNNQTTVHGRTAFGDDGSRLLKRVRILVDDG